MKTNSRCSRYRGAHIVRKYRMNAAAINAAFFEDILNPHLHKPVKTEVVEYDYFPEDEVEGDPVAEAAEREATECPVCHSHNGHSLSCPTLGVMPVLDLQVANPPIEHQSYLSDNEPRCDCGHLFEICTHPNCC